MVRVLLLFCFVFAVTLVSFGSGEVRAQSVWFPEVELKAGGFLFRCSSSSDADMIVRKIDSDTLTYLSHWDTPSLRVIEFAVIHKSVHQAPTLKLEVSDSLGVILGEKGAILPAVYELVPAAFRLADSIAFKFSEYKLDTLSALKLLDLLRMQYRVVLGLDFPPGRALRDSTFSWRGYDFTFSVQKGYGGSIVLYDAAGDAIIIRFRGVSLQSAEFVRRSRQEFFGAARASVSFEDTTREVRYRPRMDKNVEAARPGWEPVQLPLLASKIGFLANSVFEAIAARSYNELFYGQLGELRRLFVSLHPKLSE